MFVELAHQKADKHLCVALHRKVRIRLHPSMEPACRIVSSMVILYFNSFSRILLTNQIVIVNASAYNSLLTLVNW